jgi:hypothetical protein
VAYIWLGSNYLQNLKGELTSSADNWCGWDYWQLAMLANYKVGPTNLFLIEQSEFELNLVH